MHLIIDCTTTQNQLKYNGIGQYTKHIVSRLIQNPNLEITLLLFNGESTLDPYIKGSSAKVYRLGKLRISDYKNIIWYIFKILPAIKQVRREDSIYFCPYFWGGIPSLHIPTVLAVHDFILPKFNIYSEKSFLHNIIRGIQYWLEMFKARYCKAIVTCSKHTAHDFVSYFPKYPRRNIHVIYLDGEVKESDDMTWEEKMPEDYKERGYFIYMGGALSKSKNSEGVIRGYRNFIGRVGNSKRVPYLVIAGKNFTKDVDSKVVCFKNKVKDLGIKENVTFFGFYEDTQVKPLLNNSIAFIHLSLYEGFGISLVEALKSKAPVIAHNGTCYPEVLGDGGLLVNGMDEKDVGKAMYKLYTDNKLREELIEKGTQRGKLFSWDIAVRKTIEVFKEVSSNISIYTK